MKINYHVIFLLFLCSTVGYSQKIAKPYYYYQGEKVFLELDTQKIRITTEGSEISKILQSISQDNVKKFNTTQDNSRSSLQIIDQHALNRKETKRSHTTITLEKAISEKEYYRQLETYKKEPNVIIASPSYLTKNAKKLGISANFLVKLKNSTDVDLLYKKAEELQIEVLGHNKHMPLWFTLSCGKNTAINALEASNAFFETGFFESAEPDFFVQITLNGTKETAKQAKPIKKQTNPLFAKSSMLASPNDEFYMFQWGLKNTGTFLGSPTTKGIDIKAEQAWEITKGAGVNIGVFDGGIEMDHPDLKNNIFGTGYDANTSSPGKIYNEHGTSVAGVIGAVQNNNIGITGIAPKSKLISISRTGTGLELHHMINAFRWGIESTSIDVFNCSWTQNSSNEYIDDILNYVYTEGRNKKGAVIVASIGNNHTQIDTRVGFKNHPLIIVVGAIDYNGLKTTISNYGSILDLVAPGEDIITTGLKGIAGENNIDANLDYTVVNGTSFAAPFVSGVVALILSVNPTLTAKQVKNILEQSAEKIHKDVYTYATTPGRPNGAWNNQVGYGLVNAYKSVYRAGLLSCKNTQVITENVLSGGIENVRALESITATKKIGNRATVTYRAGKQIDLNPGFRVYKEALFTADIGDPCEAAARPSEKSSETSSVPEKITYVFRNNALEVVTRTETPTINSLEKSLKTSPNPFTDTLNISYKTTANSGEVTISVYAMTGVKVATLLDHKILEEGEHSIAWNASGFSTGVYLVVLTSATTKEQVKIVKL